MSTLFDNYTDPDIPGIFTFVVDNSISETQPENTRSIFMAMPLKYGDEKVMVFSKTSDLEAAVGTENSFKYGKGQFYARSFIDARATVFIKRIEDPTATFANQLLRKNPLYYGTSYIANDGITVIPAAAPDTTQLAFNGIQFKNVIEKDTLIQNVSTDSKLVEENKTETVFSLLAKGRGTGYNDLFAIYKNADEYETFDSTDDGIKNYRFNFVNMDIYENNSYNGEIKKKSNTVLFSLMDIDPTTKNMITHKSNGKVLWVNEMVGASNFYMTAKVNETFQSEIRQYPNIDSVLNDKKKPFLFVEGKSTSSLPASAIKLYDRKWYEVSMDDSVTPAVLKIQRATITPQRQVTSQAIFEVMVAGTKELKIAYIDDTSTALSLQFERYTPADPASFVPTYPLSNPLTYIDGKKAFYVLELLHNPVTNDVEFTHTPFRFLRWELYSFLMRFNMALNEGADNTSTAGFVDKDGAANLEAISQGIYEYIRDDKEIREVVYPKFTFNYLIDWTETIKVKDIYARLADRLRRTMHITSCPSVRQTSTGLSDDFSVENDVLCREQYLTFSSYNTMIYSSQSNKTHFDGVTKQTYRLPSSFYAMIDHLRVDYEYSITEPVANIEKGKLETTNLTLTHETFSEDIEKLRKIQINCIVTDGSDNYFIDQLTAYKKKSKLSLANVVKTIQYIQILLPKRLKKYLQKKETDIAITSNVINEVQEVLKPYKVATSSPDAIFKDVVINPKFDNNILTIAIRVTPAGTTEKINIPIIVQS